MIIFAKFGVFQDWTYDISVQTHQDGSGIYFWHQMSQKSMCGILSVPAIPDIDKSEVIYQKSWFYVVLCFMDHLGAEFISKIICHKSSVTSGGQPQRPEES